MSAPSPSPPVPDRAAGTLLMDAHAVARALRRMADQIIEHNGGKGLERLAIVGIHTGGVELARRLGDLIEQAEGIRPGFGVLDVSMHRDDLGQRPRLTSIQPTRLPLDLDALTVVLADDVFFTGRTARAALDALGDFGRPRHIQLAALINRGHRELPIRPDYTGKKLSTDAGDRVAVRLATGEADGPDSRLAGKNRRQGRLTSRQHAFPIRRAFFP